MFQCNLYTYNKKEEGKFGYCVNLGLLEIPIGVGFHFIHFPNLKSFEYVTVVVHLKHLVLFFLGYLFPKKIDKNIYILFIIYIN